MPVRFQIGLTGTDNPPVGTVPTEYRLAQNFPNPFNPTTTIRYELKAEGLTRLRVFNLMGQQVAELVEYAPEPPASTPSPSTRRTCPRACTSTASKARASSARTRWCS